MNNNGIRARLLVRALGGAATESNPYGSEAQRLLTLKNTQYVPGSGPTGILANLVAQASLGAQDKADFLAKRSDQEAQQRLQQQRAQALAAYLDGTGTAGGVAQSDPALGAQWAERLFGNKLDLDKLTVQRGHSVEDRDFARRDAIEDRNFKAAQDRDLAVLKMQAAAAGEMSPYEKKLVQEQGKLAAQNMQNYRNQKALYESVIPLTDGLEKLADKATYSPLGRGLNAVAGAFGRTTDGRIDQEAYKQTVANEIIPKLKLYLGGQFTEKEGERLMNTLGNPNAHPEEKKAAINAFREARKRALREAELVAFPDRQTAGGLAPAGNAGAINLNDPLGIL